MIAMFFTLAGLLLTVGGVWIALWQTVGTELTRVRSGVLAAEPTINCAIGSYGGPGGSGIHASVHNAGSVRAHDLSLDIPTMGTVWQRLTLEPGARETAQIAINDDAPFRTTRLDNPVATLTYHDRYGLPYKLKIKLTQMDRDDRRFNVGSVPGGTVEQPALKSRQLWRMRKKV